MKNIRNFHIWLISLTPSYIIHHFGTVHSFIIHCQWEEWRWWGWWKCEEANIHTRKILQEKTGVVNTSRMSIVRLTALVLAGLAAEWKLLISWEGWRGCFYIPKRIFLPTLNIIPPLRILYVYNIPLYFHEIIFTNMPEKFYVYIYVCFVLCVLISFCICLFGICSLFIFYV